MTNFSLFLLPIRCISLISSFSMRHYSLSNAPQPLNSYGDQRILLDPEKLAHATWGADGEIREFRDAKQHFHGRTNPCRHDTIAFLKVKW
jgi:hypothetical protein